jgi:hypothetical protein
MCHYQHPPLIAAEATSFLLIEKKQKIKTEKNFPARAFTFWPAFLSGHRSFITVLNQGNQGNPTNQGSDNRVRDSSGYRP